MDTSDHEGPVGKSPAYAEVFPKEPNQRGRLERREPGAEQATAEMVSVLIKPGPVFT
ncbi:hypothetical protein DPMN_119963 [Dreissena polymorpha]|uniref:Uncharacterized protein n=1 Tax=Dreissena polymorpha TaxID=45954 RepID=A0A9D4GJ24_DREPO|nr:hypothetical protein DPMN_119963 [Dreissena polymorpha]